MKALLDWLDHRTGYRGVLGEALYENIPGGARWRYVFGSMLVFAFVTQVVTGLFLWMYYSAGSQNAWESVYYIQNEVQGGWLLRGVHHYMAQAMVVLLPLHLLQVVFARAYQAPREVNYWLGLVLMLIVLGLGLTGYLLPWDQKGYWATKVATELMSLPPVVGGPMQKLVVGGSEYGHLTLTRFFALHAGILPVLLSLVLALHLAVFRRHGVTARSAPNRPDQFFWPHQTFKDAVACVVMLGAVVALVFIRGTELGAPAEPTESYGAARPEWYFLFLFQLLKKFQSEFVGAIVVPTLVMIFLFAMPLLARVKFGHVVNVVVILALVGTAGYLTYEAWDHDHYAERHLDPPSDPALLAVHNERTELSRKFLEAKREGHREYERVVELIEYFGIGREGAARLQRDDPETQGPRLFARACASCHTYLDDQGNGIDSSAPSAPNLFGIGTDAWYRRVVSADPQTGFKSPGMFGSTAHAGGDMAEFVTGDLAGPSEEQKQDLDRIIKLLVHEAELPGTPGTLTGAETEAGREALQKTFESYACTDCHKYDDLGAAGSAPDLTGIYTYPWLVDFISNPSDDRFYGSRNDRMPAFSPHGHGDVANLLTDREIDLLVRWMRGDARELGASDSGASAATAAAPERAAAAPPADTTPADAPPADAPGAPTPIGATLFRQNCARCHSHVDAAGQGIAGPAPKPDGQPNGAPNLYGFASRAWLTPFLTLDGITSPEYFGNTRHGKPNADGDLPEGGMVEFVKDNLADLDDDGLARLQQVVAALSAESQRGDQKALDLEAESSGALAAGREAIAGRFGCTDCHKFHDNGDLGFAPDLTGYGSAQWLAEMIANPEAERFYPESNDRMPAFGDRLSADEIQAIVRWLRGE